MEKLKRNTLKKLLVLLVSSIVKVSYSNGNPYRDRFQSYRQTFRVEPDKKEAERIIKSINRIFVIIIVIAISPIFLIYLEKM